MSASTVSPTLVPSMAASDSVPNFASASAPLWLAVAVMLVMPAASSTGVKAYSGTLASVTMPCASRV